MSTPISTSDTCLSQRCLPDIAKLGRATSSHRLDQVGMAQIEVPVRLAVPDYGMMAVPAAVGAYVSLAHAEAKGIHMSRLYLALQEQLESGVLDHKRISGILHMFLASHREVTDAARLDLRFELPLKRRALLSNNTGWRFYPVHLHASLRTGSPEIELLSQVRITYSSTCPCSAALARQLVQRQFAADFSATGTIDIEKVITWLGTEHGMTATPHGQRSHADIEFKGSFAEPIEGLLAVINLTESAVSTPVQTAVKREDEQEFARLNGTNLMFAEDAARRIATALDTVREITDYRVRAEHLESLHPHDAVAALVKGVRNGLTI